MTGWPGVGTTTMTAALANDAGLSKAFSEGVLWAYLDQTPDLVREIGLWCVALGAPGLPVLRQASESRRLRCVYGTPGTTTSKSSVTIRSKCSRLNVSIRWAPPFWAQARIRAS